MSSLSLPSEHPRLLCLPLRSPPTEALTQKLGTSTPSALRSPVAFLVLHSKENPKSEHCKTLTSSTTSAMVRSSKRNRLIWPDPPNRNQRSFSELPEELTFQILPRLGAIDVLTSARKVCSLWRRCCKHPMLWRTIDMANDYFFDEYHYDLDRMCRHAVDLSSGKVEDINVECFGSDDLLKYISDSSSGIKRLRLAHCDRITDEELSKAARKLDCTETQKVDASETQKLDGTETQKLDASDRETHRFRSFIGGEAAVHRTIGGQLLGARSLCFFELCKCIVQALGGDFRYKFRELNLGSFKSHCT